METCLGRIELPVPSIECNCAQANSSDGGHQMVVQIERSIYTNEPLDDCFYVSLIYVNGDGSFVCNNFESIDFDFTGLPPCFRKNFDLYKENPNLNGTYKYFVPINLHNDHQIVPLNFVGFAPTLGYNYYRWKLCPTENVDCNGSIIFPLKYKIKLSHSNPPPGTIEDCDSNVANVSIHSSVNESLNAFNFSPQPISNQLFIKNDNYDNFDIHILNLFGVTVGSFSNLKIGQTKIDMSNFESGIYIIKSYVNNRLIEFAKVVKE